MCSCVGEDLFRVKGVLCVAHAEQKYLCQAVHMIFQDEFDEEWAEGEARHSKLVFIGKNLNEDE